MKTKIFRNRFVSLGVCRVAVLTGLVSAFALYLAPCMEGQDVSTNAHEREATFIEFDVPGSSFTEPIGINPAGEISGAYFDINFVAHGFLRARDGTITTFDPPAGFQIDPSFSAINPAGGITGTYCDAITCHGFLRSADGNFTGFDVPGFGFATGFGINPAGVITGYCQDENTGALHGFLRARDGFITTFDPPGSLNTNPVSINAAGAITGFYEDASLVTHGFLLEREDRD
jgi:hypothetical protein